MWCRWGTAVAGVKGKGGGGWRGPCAGGGGCAWCGARTAVGAAWGLLPAPSYQQASYRWVIYCLLCTDFPEEDLPSDLPLVLTLALAGTGGVLLIVNITLVACFVYKRRRRCGIESSGAFFFIINYSTINNITKDFMTPLRLQARLSSDKANKS